MDEAALKELATRYDLAQLRERVPRQAMAPLRAFDAAALLIDGWRVSVTEALHAANNRPWQRVVFDAVDAPGTRVLIDVIECATPSEALDELLERLAGNQLRRLDDGPSHLGFASFQHPAAAPPAVFFALRNLCIAVVSFGSRVTEVLPWAERCQSRANESSR